MFQLVTFIILLNEIFLYSSAPLTSVAAPRSAPGGGSSGSSRRRWWQWGARRPLQPETLIILIVKRGGGGGILPPPPMEPSPHSAELRQPGRRAPLVETSGRKRQRASGPSSVRGEGHTLCRPPGGTIRAPSDCRKRALCRGPSPGSIPDLQESPNPCRSRGDPSNPAALLGSNLLSPTHDDPRGSSTAGPWQRGRRAFSGRSHHQWGWRTIKPPPSKTAGRAPLLSRMTLSSSVLSFTFVWRLQPPVWSH